MNIVFDFAGVLFHWEPAALVSQLLPEQCRTPAHADRWVEHIFQGYGGDWSEFDRGTVSPAELAHRIAGRTGLSTAQARAVIDAVPDSLQPIAGMVRLLERLQQAGRPMFFLSNMPEPYSRHLEATHPFVQWFDRGVFSADVKMIKPEPAIFAHAASCFGVDPAHTLFIDDVPANVEGARASGWQGLHFQSPPQIEAELLSRGLL